MLIISNCADLPYSSKLLNLHLNQLHSTPVIFVFKLPCRKNVLKKFIFHLLLYPYDVLLRDQVQHLDILFRLRLCSTLEIDINIFFP